MQLIKPVFLGILATAVAAPQIAVKGPMEGFLFDAPSSSLRAVTGVAGSAILGPSLAEGVDFASVAPRQNYAIAFEAGNCEIVTSLGSAALSATVVPGVVGQPDGVTWSADGTLAILFSRSGNWIQLLTGLPSAPALRTLDISSLGGTFSSIASDTSGKRLAIAVGGSNAGVYLTSDMQSFLPILRAPSVIALSFSMDLASLYALDSAVPQLTVVDLGTLSSHNLPLDGLSNPVALRSDQDAQGRQIAYVASRSDQLLRIIDVASQQVVTDVALSVAPAEIDTLGLHSFVIAARSQVNQPLWLFASSPLPAAYFVPAPSRVISRPSHPFAGGLR